MHKKYEAITWLSKLSETLLKGFLIIIISTGTFASETPEETINAARSLLNSWNGRTHILEEARGKIIRVLEADPKNYLALKEMARYHLKAGFINSKWNRYKTNLYLRGNYRPGTLQLAEETIQEALSIDPGFAEGYVLLGHIQFEKGNFNETVKSLNQAEILGTNDPWLHLNWAKLHNARGEISAAINRWKRVLQSHTTNLQAKIVAYGFLIEHHKKAEEHDEVVTLYKGVIELDPTNAWSRGNFAEYLNSTLGRNDEAIEQAQAALEIMNYGIGRRILANALYGKWADMVSQGYETDAEVFFQQALDINPDLNNVMAYGASMPTGKRLAKALISIKGVSIDAHAKDGSTALLIATNRNRTQVVKDLLELDANPNVRDKNGWTPLLSASDEGNTEIVRMLIDKGADIQAKLQGLNAANVAISKGHSELATMIRKLEKKSK